MFSRRHPFLFFIAMLAGCLSFMVVGVAGFAFLGSGMVMKHFKQTSLSADKGNIGIVEIKGVILSSRKIIQDLKKFRDDDAIKAIILRIDSPGGGIGPSQEIYREIMKIRQDKKIIASMGSVAASGGYYIACATSGIVANPGTITGSIGVIMEYANLMDIAKK